MRRNFPNRTQAITSHRRYLTRNGPSIVLGPEHPKKLALFFFNLKKIKIK